MEWVSATLKSFGSLVGALMPAAKQRLAERAAGKAPEAVANSVSDDLLDAAIVRLGALQPEDPIWKRCVVGLEASIVRPDIFAMPSVREWISRKQVREGLKAAVEAAIGRGAAPVDVLHRLADEYADATGDDRRFADQPIRVAVAFLQASVQGLVRDTGTAAIVQASAAELGRRIDDGVASLAEAAGLSKNSFVSERFTLEARQDLEKILRRRATQGQKIATDLRRIVSEFEDGCRLAAAAKSVQQEAKYWLARVEAGAGNAEAADQLLVALDRQGFNVPEAAWALVDLARDQPERALRRVRGLADAESRTAVFHILLKSEGPHAALQFVDGLGSLEPAAFSAVGWNNICTTMISEKRAPDACEILSQLPPVVLSRCTHLYYMYAVSLLLPTLPPDRQSSLMAIGFASVAEHSLDSPESINAQARAIEAARQAKQFALDAEDHVLAERCESGIRGLRLLDPSTRAEEVASIQEAMKDGETAARLIWVVRAYNIEFDTEPLENYLAHAQRLGGLNEEQLRARLYLLNHPERSGELVRFLDEEWTNLLPDNSPEALVVMKVQALANLRDVDGATAFLDAHLKHVGDPLHLAASLFNAPFSQLLIAVPRQNAFEVDPRRRQPVPIRSGNRLPMASHVFSRIALDITSLFVLSELDKLKDVLDSYDEVFVSPRVMDVLLEDRGRVAFHQPSRIAEVKPLSALLSTGRLHVVEIKGDESLVREVGDEAASLLSAASTQGGRYVHPGPLFKVASFMEEEAELGELAPLLADTIDVANALREEGVITQAVCDEGVSVLARTGKVSRLTVAPTTPVFLDGLAVQYLQQAKLLQPLLNSGHTVSIHKSTVDEWQALLATEPMTAELTEAIDAVRLSIRAGLMSGKVKFLTQSRRQRDRLNAITLLPMIDLLEDTAQIEVAVVDDRMLGSNASLTDSAGRSVPVISSLDLMDGLVKRGKLTDASRREALHLLRARCFFCIPIDPVDLQFYLTEATVVNGKLRETAELRVVRQYLSRLNSTDVLCTASDLAYQDALWRVGSLIIGRLWIDPGVATADASVKADWIVANVIPDPELAMRFAEHAEARIAQVVASQLSVSLMAPSADRARRDAYSLWLERSRLSTFLPANANVLDIAADQAAELLLQRTQEVAIELRSRNSPRTAE